MPSERHPQLNSPEPSLKTIEATERATEYVAFLKFVAQSTGSISYAQLAILYPAVCQGAMEWLLNEKKSVDFGFVILHPRPHRANWKQILVAAFPTLGPTLLGRPRAVKDALLTGAGFHHKLLDSGMLAIASERYVVWGVETELKRSWWRAMFRLESFKLARMGSVEYARAVAKAIVKLTPKLTRSYLAHLREISFPVGCVRGGHKAGRGFIAPYVARGKALPKRESNVAVDAVVPRYKPGPPTLERPPVLPTDTGLLALHPLSSTGQNLRVSRDDEHTGG